MALIPFKSTSTGEGYSNSGEYDRLTESTVYLVTGIECPNVG